MASPSVPGAPTTAFAPGRVNLIGDHTDYNGGLALPVAIGLGTTVTVRRDRSRRLTVASSAEPAPVELDLASPVASGAHRPAVRPPVGPAWGVLAAALVDQVRPPWGGAVQVDTTLPIGAGLSSSAALCVALAMALGARAGPLEMARLCQRAERAAGADVGLLDPLAIAGARPGHALLIDFAALTTRHVPVPPEAALTVVHSGVRRSIEASPYAARRRQCDEAARLLGAPLGSLDPADLGGLADPVLRRRARHVVTECERVRSLVAVLVAGDLHGAGQLMDESHRSLICDFEASTGAVDELAALLRGRPGVHGARMTGGGFGGCVVALAEPGALDPSGWGAPAWSIGAAAGARVLAGPEGRTAR